MFDAESEGWREVRLGNVASVNPESLGQRTDPGLRFGYIDISQIEQPGLCAGWTPTNFGAAPSRARRKVRENDILVSTVRPYLRAFAKVPPCDQALIASTGFAVVRADDLADQDFLFQHVMTEGFVEHLKPRMTGSNYPAVSADDVADYPLLLPPLDEQRRIAEVLRSVDEAVTAANNALEQAEIVRADLVLDAFKGPDGDKTTLGDLCALIYRYPGFYGFEQRAFGVPVIRGEHLRNGRVSTDWDNFYFVDPVFSARFPKTILAKDDVVMSVRGTVGTTAVIEEAHVGSQISPNLIRLVADPARLLPPLLTFAVQSAVEFMRATIVNAQALPAINAGDIKKVEITVPPLGVQHDVLARLTSAVHSCAFARATLQQHLVTKARLSDDLLSGRVRVPS